MYVITLDTPFSDGPITVATLDNSVSDTCAEALFEVVLVDYRECGLEPGHTLVLDHIATNFDRFRTPRTRRLAYFSWE